MKKNAKWLPLLLCLLLALTAPAALAAETDVARVTGTDGDVRSYPTLEEAFDDIRNGDTVELLTDAVLSAGGTLTVENGVEVTLFGNGHTVTMTPNTQGNRSGFFVVKAGGTLHLGAENDADASGLTLDGKNTYTTAPLLTVSGTATMHEGVTICNSYGAGGMGSTAVTVQRGVFRMTGGVIRDNYTCILGIAGAVFADNGGTIEITGGKLLNNTAVGDLQYGYGGAIYAQGGSHVTLSDCELRGNRIEAESEGFGGAVMLFGCADAVIDGCQISGNYAPYGGGVCLISTSASITDTRIQDNEALYGGGLLLMNTGSDTKATVTGTHITGNKALAGGGIFLSAGSAFTMGDGSAVYGNTASEAADDFYVESENTSLTLLDVENVQESVEDAVLNGYFEDFASDDADYAPLTDAETLPARFADAETPVKVDALAFSGRYVCLKTAGVFSVSYTDGAAGEVFETQTHTNLRAGDPTPAFDGTPERDGYTFTGWTPSFAETVSGNAVYTAQWQKKTSAAVTHGSLTLIKTDENGNPLDGARFGLYDNDACAGEPLLTLDAGSTVLSTENTALAALLPESGRITLFMKELQAPAGYMGVGTVWQVVIEAQTDEALQNGTFVTTTAYTVTVDGKDVLTVANTAAKEPDDESAADSSSDSDVPTVSDGSSSDGTSLPQTGDRGALYALLPALLALGLGAALFLRRRA